MPRPRPSPAGSDRMPAAFAGLLLVPALLIAADQVVDRRSGGESGWRRSGILDAIRGTRRASAAPVEPVPAAPAAAGSSATLARINAMFVEMAAGTRHRLRIAYLGDSLIEGDLITSELRSALQAQLGGRGVGFVPLALPTAHLRDTIRTSTGSGWTYHLLAPHDAPVGPYGIAASYAQTPADPAQAWVSFEGGLGRWRGDLPAADFYYGSIPRHVLADPAAVRVRTARGAASFPLTGTGLVNRVRVHHGPAASLTLDVTGAAHLPLYGVSFETPGGVVLDSVGLRGSVGNELAALPVEILRAFQSHLAYDVVILHFGVNVLYPAPEDYTRYRRALRATLSHLADGLPGAAILVVSVTDRGWRGPEGLGSHPHLGHVVEAQRAAAADTDAAFFDLYRAMGGPGTMIRWAAMDPPLARKDYTHFNHAGAKRIAGLFKKYLIGGDRANAK